MNVFNHVTKYSFKHFIDIFEMLSAFCFARIIFDTATVINIVSSMAKGVQKHHMQGIPLPDRQTMMGGRHEDKQY